MKNCGLKLQASYVQLSEVFYSKVAPVPVPNPSLILLNKALAGDLGFDFSHLSELDIAALLSGNQLLDGSIPFAQAYAGHQFGHFTVLGDGRAHVLGEHQTPDGHVVDIQLKGSGQTPYSRHGDGRAVLGPMLREYIISEAMYSLGIPTTRSLAVVTTGEQVQREALLPGAILTRIASSHLRVGTFEFAAAQQNIDFSKQLLEYAINRHLSFVGPREQKALALLEYMVEQQTSLMVHWMRVGFIHGVMNTDNMAISGETIDYGPCAFMDAYDPSTVFSSIDQHGRYAFANQPVIAKWNMARLAESLLPLIDDNPATAVAKAEAILNTFNAQFEQKWLAMMRAKLGLIGEQAGDEALIKDLLQWMQQHHADYTNTFLMLSHASMPEGDVYQQQNFIDWYQRWQQRLQKNQKPISEAVKLMQQTNPAVIPRNHQVEKVLAAAYKGELQPLHDLLAVLKTPYKNSSKMAPYQQLPDSSERVYQTFCGT